MEYFFDYAHQILINYPAVAPIIFIIIQTLAAIFFIPCSPLTLMAGAIWGGAYGFLISVIASVIASTTTFLLGRVFLRKKIEYLISSRYARLGAFLSQITIHDWKIIAVSQMNPFMPASTLGYFFGVSTIKLRTYILFSLIFMLPLQFLFVFTGHSIINLIQSNGHPILFFLLFGVALILFTNKSIYKKLCEILGVNDGI